MNIFLNAKISLKRKKESLLFTEAYINQSGKKEKLLTQEQRTQQSKTILSVPEKKKNV